MTNKIRSDNSTVNKTLIVTKPKVWRKKKEKEKNIILTKKTMRKTEIVKKNQIEKDNSNCNCNLTPNLKKLKHVQVFLYKQLAIKQIEDMYSDPSIILGTFINNNYICKLLFI